MRFPVSSLVLMVASVLSPGQTTRTAPTTLTEDEIRALIRQAAEKDIENDRRRRDYTYVEREEQHKLDGSGHTKSVESKTKEIMVLYGEPLERLIAKVTSLFPRRMRPRKTSAFKRSLTNAGTNQRASAGSAWPKNKKSARTTAGLFGR